MNFQNLIHLKVNLRGNSKTDQGL